MKDEPSRRGPLSGVTVVEAATVIAAPMTAAILADYGARVIKVEHPQTGDSGRDLGPHGNELWWKYLNRNKEFVTCDLRSTHGAELFGQLVARADVLIENFRSQTLERWGLGYEALQEVNPHLIMLRITGFGQIGPWSDRPGYGALAESLGGLTHMTGQPDGPPTLPGAPVADPLGAGKGAAAIAMSLWARDRGETKGYGEEIDLSLYAPMLSMLGMHLTASSSTGEATGRGVQLGQKSLRGVAQARDQDWISYSILAGRLIANTAALLRDEGYLGPKDETAHSEGRAHEDNTDRRLIEKALHRWVADNDRDAVLARLESREVPCAPILDSVEALNYPFFNARGDYVDLDDDDLGALRMPHPPARLRNRPPQVDWSGRSKGRDNEQIYHDWLGISDDELEQLRSSRAI